jgi:ketosteroid isomerase-like protein
MMITPAQFHREAEMIEHPNSFLVHQCLQAVSRGDTETLRALWADDIVWHVKGKSPWQGEIRGHNAIFEYLAQLGEMGSRDYNVELEDVMVGEERAAISFTVKASIEGRTLKTRMILLARIAGRRIHEIITIPIDADRVESFWQI